ncbi:leukemia inhibitory factor receptor-like isoform X1 [Sander lucioperca]|uniref:leukemia inhibitory factor receptor-like isoform X1 n=1 Tax=Sander lucioperca TaxID=283035 RepID=UPI00125D66D7|nr:leukemia inhibitory factor receptor-like isoform X1 [Sander lucioperca]XP_035847268.1 leukemia inhibitory factor receptor-like isoform X1 [Sander lucioperca]
MVLVKGIMMILWLLLVSLFCKSTQDGNGQESGVLHCGSQNLKLTSSGQMILLTWEDTPLCSAVQDVLIYELEVLIADNKEHYDEVAVTPDQIGSTHSWNWTSYLALECTSHSVRLRSRYKNYTSPWNQETLPGLETSRAEVYPKDKHFKVGSTVTFCCVLPAGVVFGKMYLYGYSSADMNTTRISNQTYALTVHLNQASSNSCTNVICELYPSVENGACAYIGYPPIVTDLQCETRDLQSVECHWTYKDSSLPFKSPTEYHLLESPTICAKSPETSCSQTVQVDARERNWTLTASNSLGEVKLSDTADLTKRVHMYPPEGVTALSVNARNVSLEWKWTVQQYYNLSLICQVNINNHGENTISEHFGVGLNFAVLNDLIPNWTYNVEIRCRTAQHFWKWSTWSTNVNFHTKGDVPDALDVWMQVMDNQIITIWKVPLANQSHGHIEDYEVTWTKTTERERRNRTKVAPNNYSLALSLDTTVEHIVTVTARNIHGSSSPSTITIPSSNPDRTRVNTSLIIGSNGSFNLSWSASPTASCGYIVDWCPTLGKCTVEWLKVPPNQTNASIFSKNFKDGLRYTLSVYACTQGAPVLLQRSEGYVGEKKIQDGLFKSFKGQQQNWDYELSWEPISLREQTALIQGYVLYLDDNKKVNFSTDNPEATSLTARNLKIGSYKFTVKARTAVGECGATSITATLNSLTDDLIKTVFISLATVLGLLSLITIVCYRHWTCIKETVYPPIPKPVLTSTGEHGCRHFQVDQCHYSEADIMDVPELYCSAGAPINGLVSQENMPFVFSQTPKGYYNQPLKKYIPPPLTLPSMAIPSQSGLPSSSFRSEFPNLSYNLIMQPGNQQSNLCPELQEGTSLERSSDGYQPHDQTETLTTNQTEEDPDSPMSCVSTYILLPQSSSR